MTKSPAPDASGAPVVLWFRNDLRLADQPAVAAATASGRPVLPVYVLDDAAAGNWAQGGASRWWLHHSLAALAASLSARGATLVLRRGRAEAELADLVRATGATEVITGRPPEPWARQQDQDVARALKKLGASLSRHRTTLLFDADEIRTGTGGFYGVYTPFSRACFARGAPPMPTPAPKRLNGFAPPPGERLESWRLLPTKPDWSGGLTETWTPGEAGAAKRLAAFAAAGHVQRYDAKRNIPGEPGTSMLSPHLHFGEISPAQVWHAAVHAAQASGDGLETFLKEILWREFAAYLLWHHPSLPEAPMKPEFAAMPWRDDHAGLRAWQHGRTGVPIVDAGMRQLWHTGWMHNRVRMIVASFLVKHLLVPWQRGQDWFWDTLVDADLASNSASWQWVAGSGADAAPFFRIFNPVLQGLKFDPDGTYVRRWVPELRDVPDAHVHAPWDAGGPAPIVDLAAGRERALAAYKQISKTAA